MPGVYVSYPFCAQKCTFCNFSSGVASAAVREKYETALLKEMSKHAWKWQPDTLYLGGGTPSSMPADGLAKIFERVPSGSLKEVTIECAPGTLDEARVQEWLCLGVNRISLGVQSFVTDELKRVGRKHTARLVADEVAMLRRAGLDNINIDLIAGLPGQTERSWRESLDWIGALAPPHVSVYLFEVDDESAIGKEVGLQGQRYSAGLLPSEESMADFYEQAVESLRALGIDRYEISNFARRGFDSLHNLKYWQLAPYVGFGLDAHSFDGQQRYANASELIEYLKLMEAGDSACIETSQADHGQERFFVGLRLQAGVTPSASEWSRFDKQIARSLDFGLLENDGGTIRLTNRGVLLSNEVFQDFVSA